MAENSGIQWTDHTFNGWIGCFKISDACKHCYAEVSTPARTLRAGGLEVWGPAASTERKKTSATNWKLPERWNRAALKAGRRARVFCSSLADVFEDHPSLAPWRAELFALIERTPALDWQVLTKRPENIRRMVPASWLDAPRANVWFGTTVENQETADKRIPELLAVPAVVRFLSCEPLLEAVDLLAHGDVLCRCGGCMRFALQHGSTIAEANRIDWVIVGGESGPSARPFDLAWARAIVAQCQAAGVPVFVKQLGSRPVERIPVGIGPIRRVSLTDSHGGDMDEWPGDLRLREMPEVMP